MLRRLTAPLLLALLACAAHAQSGQDISGPALPPTVYPILRIPASNSLGEHIVPGRIVVIYRAGASNANAEAEATRLGARVVNHLSRLNISALAVPAASQAAVAASLATNPEVAAVLNDRLVTTHSLQVRQVQTLQPRNLRRPTDSPDVSAASSPGSGNATQPAADAYYNSPQGWAVRQAGGFGNAVPGGSLSGPWNLSLGTGVRIAILDSGVDQQHPDIAPNLALNLTEVDSTALPSPCDDGSPQDQQGHGTWVASLAAGALGGGETIGVAPQASLLNIKVIERLPLNTGSTTISQCEGGQASGLLSWVLQGINDAIANHADIITLSLGTLVDTTTGDGAGWKAAFDQITYAATQAGTVIITAVGNDGLNLSTGNLIELPAQARGVLPVVASTNPACAENLTAGATCSPGPITRPYYSNYGITLNALAAPGGSYPEGPNPQTDTGISGWVRGACSQGQPNTTDGLPSSGQSLGCFNLGHTPYVQAMGTSAAAPLVAGAAAILRAVHPQWTAAQIVAALITSATSTSSMTEPQLNLPGALAQP
jgi:lantibiotic leader peptide-processing serine protease